MLPVNPKRRCRLFQKRFVGWSGSPSSRTSLICALPFLSTVVLTDRSLMRVVPYWKVAVMVSTPSVFVSHEFGCGCVRASQPACHGGYLYLLQLRRSKSVAAFFRGFFRVIRRRRGRGRAGAGADVPRRS